MLRNSSRAPTARSGAAGVTFRRCSSSTTSSHCRCACCPRDSSGQRAHASSNVIHRGPSGDAQLTCPTATTPACSSSYAGGIRSPAARSNSSSLSGARQCGASSRSGSSSAMSCTRSQLCLSSVWSISVLPDPCCSCATSSDRAVAIAHIHASPRGLTLDSCRLTSSASVRYCPS